VKFKIVSLSKNFLQVNAQIACLKWSQPHYAQQLKQTMSTQLDYEKHPSEDYAHATVTFKDQKGQHVIGISFFSFLLSLSLCVYV
jgi:hypothetical protein